MEESKYIKLLRAWNLEFAGTEDTALIEGSPERTAARTVILDTAGGRWILEKIHPENLKRKQELAGTLESLAGLEQIHPYRRTADGSFFAEEHMLRPYVEGIPLQRPNYLNDPWRLDEMTRFLTRLREETSGWTGRPFSIAAYAVNRMTAWRTNTPKRALRLEHTFQTLEKNFFPVHDRLPHAFCHGDYHPLNMIWGESSIRSVIDWEFCGSKPELYDAALLIGCIGFEEPDNLIHEPVVRIIRNLRSAGFGTEESWSCFLELVAAIRFGWMSEWIRRRNEEAIEMEAVYLDILVDQKEYILEKWGTIL